MSHPGGVTLFKEGGTFVLTATGEFDQHNSDKLRAAGRLAITDAGCRVLRIDLGAVSFLDSTALRALVNLGNDCTAAAVSFEVCEPGPRVRTVLTAAGLDHLLLTADRRTSGADAQRSRTDPAARTEQRGG